MTRTALYARVSSPRQAQTQTIEQQLERLHAELEQRGLTVAPEHIFRDDALSGAKLNRPGLERLRDQITLHEIDLVLITAPDRLARKYVHQVLLIEEFEKRGCRVEFVERPMSNDPHDQLLLQIRGAVAEYERSLISERMRRGRLAKLKAGVLLPWTRAPYGYRVDPMRPRNPAGVRLEPNEAAIVQQIFTWYLEEGTTLLMVFERLRTAQIPSPKGWSVWVPSSIRRILKNEVYIGTAFGNRFETIPAQRRRSALKNVGNAGISQRERPRADWIAIPVPAIIAQELFERTQIKLEHNRRSAKRNNAKHEYLLRCLVSCGRCRCACSARHTVTGQDYYSCSLKTNYERAQRVQSGPCSARYTPAKLLDDLVWKDVCSVLTDPDVIRLALERVHGGQWLPQELQARQRGLRSALAQLANQEARLLEAYLAGVVDLREFERTRIDVARRREQVGLQLRQLEASVERRAELAALADSIDEFRAMVNDGLGTADFARRRVLVELLIDQVVVEEERVEIRYAIPLSRAGPHVPFCRLRFDYFNRIRCVHRLPDRRWGERSTESLETNSAAKSD
jgi:site-specific DNA recombinase